MRTIASTDLSFLAFFIPSCNPSLTCAERAFTGGEFSVNIAIFESVSKLVTSLITTIFFPFA